VAVRIEEPFFFVIALFCIALGGLDFLLHTYAFDISGLAILAMSLFDHKSNSL
jgi:hypothetical protein